MRKINWGKRKTKEIIKARKYKNLEALMAALHLLDHCQVAPRCR